jgi:pimeloyl-ACP methyl ester carboxylesterase
MQHANVNGIRIAYGVRGSGPPLVLIMGYRLSSLAWPLDFIDALEERFTVVLFDNRGTGGSEKPTFGYEIANMARDLGGLLDHLKIPRAHVLGYSMGGAIAQEFARQFPDRVSRLVLCATMCGGPRATYAPPSVIRVMRELDGLTSEDIARRIWRVTYSPVYLENHRKLAEEQMRRETTAPTPLHAADLQYQAFAEFDCSGALPKVEAQTLVLTGDRDELISPQNARLIAALIPRASLIVIPSCGHRLMWEATDECVGFITEFLTGEGRTDNLPLNVPQSSQTGAVVDFINFLTPAVELLASWPWMLAGAGADTMTIARQSIYFGGGARFGDGKPVVLLPTLGCNLFFQLLSDWLKVLGYRAVAASGGDRSIADLIRATAQRIGRKVVLVASASEAQTTLGIAATHKDWVSDVILLNASYRADTPAGARVHLVASGWWLLATITALPELLRNIRIELIDASSSTPTDASPIR